MIILINKIAREPSGEEYRGSRRTGVKVDDGIFSLVFKTTCVTYKKNTERKNV